MLRRFALAGSFVAILGAHAVADSSPRMPPGTRTSSSGHLVSGRGLRDTTEYFAKQLARLGIAVRQVGPYRMRGVEVTRFVSETPTTTWLAIHVWRTAGQTTIFVVPRGGT